MKSVIEILLVEDNPADARLTQEVLSSEKIWNHLSTVPDGRSAMAFLRREGEYAGAPAPDLILLDLNLPGMDGRTVLSEIKKDDALKHIPVIILTSSQLEEDIRKSYNLHANCYITKPVDIDEFIKVVISIEDFWLTIAKLPEDSRRRGPVH
jgi:CheY-like chemotaxis protein